MVYEQTTIFQTLEDRGNTEELEKSGPCFCDVCDDNGQLKRGVKEPWLGAGYYFWDTRIEDAHWWGKEVYHKQLKGYVIGKTTYDAHSDALFDMLGKLSHFDEFIKVAKLLAGQHGEKRISFPKVITYLQKNPHFATRYKAIRVCPISEHFRKSCVYFPHSATRTPLTMGIIDKVQICFFDRSLLTEPFRIVEHKPYTRGFTF